MEILPYCVCCCVRGISHSFQLCSITHKDKERKDASQQQNKRIRKQASLQARKKQETQQRERRKREQLALTFSGQQGEVGRLGGRRVLQSESSDNIQNCDKRGARQDHSRHYNDIANVHGGDATSEDVGVRQRREEAEKLERVRQVEQTTVHTVITTHEKIHNMAGTKHLPAITTAKQEEPQLQVHVHGAAKIAPGDHHRQRAMRAGGSHDHDHYGRGEGGHDDDHYARRGGGRSGSIGGSGSETQGHRQAGVHHLKSLIRADSGDSRADARKTEILRMRMREKEKKQRKMGQDRKDAKNAKNSKDNKLGGAKRKK